MRAAVISNARKTNEKNKKMTTVARMDQSEFWATIRKSQLTKTYVDFAEEVIKDYASINENRSTDLDAPVATKPSKRRALMKRLSVKTNKSSKSSTGDKLIDSLDRKESIDLERTANRKCCLCCENLPVINPQSNPKLAWDFFVALLIFYSVLMIPYAISFGTGDSESIKILDWIVDTCFAIDMVLNFFTGYRINTDNYVDAKGSIAIHYLKTWFTIDLFSTLPIDTIASGILTLDSSNSKSSQDIKSQLRTFKLIRGLRLLRLLKLARLFKLKKLASVLQESELFHPAILKVMSLLFKIVFVAHFLACFWYLVGSPESNADARDGWVTVFDIQDEPNSVKYSYSFYWTVATMMAVGYGDIYPKSTSEMLYAIFAQTTGAMIFGLIIGTVSTVLETADARGSEIKRQDDEVTEWMRSRKLDLKLRLQIRNHFEYVNSIKSAFEERSILERLPVTLRNEVMRHSKKDIFEKVTFLNTLSDGFLHELLLEMRPMQLAAGETLWQHGNRCRYFYMIRQGLVQYEVPTKDLMKWNLLPNSLLVSPSHLESQGSNTNDREDSSSPYKVEVTDTAAIEPGFTPISVFTEGSHFGNEKIIPLTESARAYVTSVTDFFVLSIDDLKQICTMFTDDKYKVEAEAERRLLNIKEAAKQINANVERRDIDQTAKSRDAIPIVHNGKLMNRGLISNFWPSQQRKSTFLRFRSLKRNITREEWSRKSEVIHLRRRKSLSAMSGHAIGESRNQVAKVPSVHDAVKLLRNVKSNNEEKSKSVIPVEVGAEEKYSEYIIAEEDQVDLAARWIIFPHRAEKINWDMIMAMLIVYSVAIIPYRICFNMDAEGLFYVFDRMVDVLFALDMLLTFRTAYFQREDKVYVTVPYVIAQTYLKSWFLVDFLSTFPVDSIVMEIVSSSQEGSGLGTTDSPKSSLRAFKLIRALRLIRLLKLARLLKLGKFLKSVEEWLELSPAAFKLLKLVLQVTFIAHLLACFWYYTSSAEEEEVRENWWNQIENLADADVNDHYVSALYWAFTTMTTVGYGDLTPQTGTERSYSIIVMILGATVFGYIVGNVSQMVGRLDVGAVRQREQMDHIKNYMIEQDLPRKMRFRIERFFEFYYQRTSIFDEKRILRDLPPTLRRDVVIHINKHILRSFRSFFSGVNNELKMAILIALRPSFCLAFSDLYTFGDGATEIYFLQKGVIRVLYNCSGALQNLSVSSSKNTEDQLHSQQLEQYKAQVKAQLKDEANQYGKSTNKVRQIESDGKQLDEVEKRHYRDLKKGDVFGFMDFVLGSNRQETAFALEYASVMVLPRTSVWMIVAGAPDLAKDVQHLLAKHLDQEDTYRSVGSHTDQGINGGDKKANKSLLAVSKSTDKLMAKMKLRRKKKDIKEAEALHKAIESSAQRDNSK